MLTAHTQCKTKKLLPNKPMTNQFSARGTPFLLFIIMLYFFVFHFLFLFCSLRHRSPMFNVAHAGESLHQIFKGLVGLWIWDWQMPYAVPNISAKSICLHAMSVYFLVAVYLHAMSVYFCGVLARHVCFFAVSVCLHAMSVFFLASVRLHAMSLVAMCLHAMSVIFWFWCDCTPCLFASQK